MFVVPPLGGIEAATKPQVPVKTGTTNDSRISGLAMELIQRLSTRVRLARCLSLLLLLIVCSCWSPNDTWAQTDDESATAALTEARENVKLTKLRYQRIKRLGQRGSASQKEVRDAELRKRLALLELADLLSPEHEDHNSLMRATVVYNYRNQEFKITETLYQRGSASELEFDRAQAALDIALANLKSAQSDTDSQRKFQAIKAASTRLKTAEKVHQLAQKLYSRGSISQTQMDQASSNLKIAESELAEAKQALGATATPVEQ